MKGGKHDYRHPALRTDDGIDLNGIDQYSEYACE